ncbi:MAG: DNA-binding MarR family transcriptional regulator [Planctomycetota bacterium]
MANGWSLNRAEGSPTASHPSAAYGEPPALVTFHPALVMSRRAVTREDSESSSFLKKSSPDAGKELYIQPMALTRKQSKRISEECLGLRIRLLNRVVSRIYDDELRSLEIKINQYTILVALSLRKGLSAAELGKALELEKSSLSRNLRTMSNLGWISQSDGVEITAAGERMLAKAHPAWKRAQGRVNERLGSDGVQAIYDAAGRLLG